MWRSVTQHHPTIGYTFIPGIKSRVILPSENVGYLIKVNEHGFRCDHEFETKRREGVTRALLFGDSFTAGDGVSNPQRYGDQLERLIPNLEIYNFGLPGTGTDQHYLAYQEFAAGIEHDLLILGVTVENIGRVAAHFRPYINEDGETGLLVPPANPEALAQAILHLLEAPMATRQRMGESAARRVRETFTTERMVNETAALYRELLG